MNKTMYLIAGDKGGVGKSVMANVLVDRLLARHDSITVVEGDASIPDVAERHVDVLGVRVLMSALSRPDRKEQAVAELFEQLENLKSGADAVLINTPASVGETLDEVADLLTEVAHDMGYKVVVGWMVTDDRIGIQHAGSSALCANADRKIAIVNAAFTAGKTWAESPERAEWVKSGGTEALLPALDTDGGQEALRTSTGRLSGLTTTGSFLLRRTFARWLNGAANKTGAYAAADAIIGPASQAEPEAEVEGEGEVEG